jgi:hypothetical protein
MDNDALKQTIEGLISSGDGSISSLYELLGMDYQEELDKITKDKVSKAKFDIESQFEVEQAQFLASKDINTRLDGNPHYKELLTQATDIASQLSGADPSTLNSLMVNLKLENYPLYMLTVKLMNEGAMTTPGQDPNQQGQQGQQGQGDDGSGGASQPGGSAGQAQSEGASTSPGQAGTGSAAKSNKPAGTAPKVSKGKSPVKQVSSTGGK